MIEFRILGSLEVVDDDHPVALGGPGQRALLAVLLLHRREPVSSDRLVDELWGGRPPATARKIVQGYVSSLRKELGDGVVVSRGHAYLLEVEPDQTDVDRFESLAADGQRALAQDDPGRAADLLGEALGLWRGPALAEFTYESFAQSEIGRLEESRLAALGDRIDAELALGRHEQLVPELESLVREHPLRERFTGQLMLALYQSGRQADALETYRSARTHLVDELGLNPGRRLHELEQGILAQDPALDGSPRRGRPELPDGARRRGRGELLIAAGGGVLLAALAALVVVLTNSGGSTVRVAGNSLAAIDVRTDRVVGVAAVGARPGPVAFGSGSLWVANLDDHTVSRIDPNSLRTLRTIPLPGTPTGLASSAGGTWVAESNANPGQSSVSVSRVDPAFNALGVTVKLGNVVPGGPGALAMQGSSVWAAPSSGLLSRLDALTGSVRRRLDPNSGSSGVAVGDGAVWLTDSEAGNVIRVDSSGLRTPIAVGNGPTAIAVGRSGVWVIDSLDEALVRIDPDTDSVTATIPVGRSPSGVAVGAGSVWVANSGDGTVTRIDPRTDKAISTILVGGSPQALTVAGGRVWVTIDGRSIAPTDTVSGGGTLRIVSFNDVDHMDPALAYSQLSLQLVYATCAKLVNYPDKAGAAGSQLTPEVAQALPTHSRDGKAYTFTIRPGFRFSPPSNQPVTAQTFKDSIERTLNPAMHSAFSNYLGNIVGARRYEAGKASRITGILARPDKLTIRLNSPAPDFLSQIALSGFCAVPSGTPIDPNGLRLVPSAGPYYTTSYTPGHGLVLTRNPNYHGTRPHHFAHIELAVGIPASRAVHEIEAGKADYTTLGFTWYPETTAISDLVRGLAARYRVGRSIGERGRPQFFANPILELDYLALNTHRPLFGDVRLRQAVNYAIDRRALAAIGSFYGPEPPTDQYLTPGMPGYRTAHIYPTRPDPTTARRLVQSAHADGRTAVLYSLDSTQGRELAQIVKNNLVAVGIQVQIKTFPADALFARLATPGEPFDLSYAGWVADHPDPSQMLNWLLEGKAGIPSFNDPAYRHRLAAASRLSGPQRYLAYGALDLDLARNAAPLAAFGNNSNFDFFATRVGCQTFGAIYGMDLAALCLKRPHRQ